MAGGGVPAVLLSLVFASRSAPRALESCSGVRGSVSRAFIR